MLSPRSDPSPNPNEVGPPAVAQRLACVKGASPERTNPITFPSFQTHRTSAREAPSLAPKLRIPSLPCSELKQQKESLELRETPNTGLTHFPGIVVQSVRAPPCQGVPMATLIRSSNLRAPPLPSLTTSHSFKLLNSSSFSVTFRNTNSRIRLFSNTFVSKPATLPVPNFLVLASSGDSPDTETETETEIQQQLQPDIQDNTDRAGNGEMSEDSSSSDDEKPDVDAPPTSPALTALKLYKEALDNNDEDKVAELEAFFKSLEDEKNALDRRVLSLSQDISVERERVLRISADFDNFRKRTDRERLSLVTNAQGELIENFLPVVDNFERAKSQIKVETEAEEKISNSYQSIYKQFFEILSSIGVLPVETVGKPFDPMKHNQVGLNFSQVLGKLIGVLNAIMREESTEYDEDVIIEQYRKGFKLGDRLLRPSMVKVSAGPGPEKPDAAESSVHEDNVTEPGQIVEDEGDTEDQTTS
ncbi:hypothetical protein KSS87_007734 [Heliosperma pusillum]|nr:hypothetical protein KSS87_007734 [Heliosperma pusillum]